MFDAFFLRRRAFKVGQSHRHMHEEVDAPLLSGQRLLNLAKEQWESYCEEKDEYGFRRLKHNDYLSATYQKALIQGYLAEDRSSWEQGRVKD